MSAWSWLVLGVGLLVFQSPITAYILARFLRTSIDNERKADHEQPEHR